MFSTELRSNLALLEKRTFNLHFVIYGPELLKLKEREKKADKQISPIAY
ncbi:protein of unknown function [endosymbiont DhMRE of Dentiscutata heterogama]|nr:protein of unknown function [endosymbiont DhMRE of Dentiscutata heterogama]